MAINENNNYDVPTYRNSYEVEAEYQATREIELESVCANKGFGWHCFKAWWLYAAVPALVGLVALLVVSPAVRAVLEGKFLLAGVLIVSAVFAAIAGALGWVKRGDVSISKVSSIAAMVFATVAVVAGATVMALPGGHAHGPHGHGPHGHGPEGPGHRPCPARTEDGRNLQDGNQPEGGPKHGPKHECKEGRDGQPGMKPGMEPGKRDRNTNDGANNTPGDRPAGDPQNGSGSNDPNNQSNQNNPNQTPAPAPTPAIPSVTPAP